MNLFSYPCLLAGAIRPIYELAVRAPVRDDFDPDYRNHDPGVSCGGLPCLISDL